LCLAQSFCFAQALLMQSVSFSFFSAAFYELVSFADASLLPAQVFLAELKVRFGRPPTGAGTSENISEIGESGKIGFCVELRVKI